MSSLRFRCVPAFDVCPRRGAWFDRRCGLERVCGSGRGHQRGWGDRPLDHPQDAKRETVEPGRSDHRHDHEESTP